MFVSLDGGTLARSAARAGPRSGWGQALARQRARCWCKPHPPPVIGSLIAFPLIADMFSTRRASYWRVSVAAAPGFWFVSRRAPP